MKLIVGFIGLLSTISVASLPNFEGASYELPFIISKGIHNNAPWNPNIPSDITALKLCDLAKLEYYIADFDEAMYATKEHKNIYQKLISSAEETTFINLLRENYMQFFNNPPYSIRPKIPKIIHHIWLGGTMPEQYVLWRKTWQEMHPDWVFMLWTDKEIANIKLENQYYFNQTKSFGEKANLLRYEILYQFGGLYVDTDCICFKTFDLLHHCCDFYAGCEFPQKQNWGIMVGNSIMGSRPAHPLMAKFIDNIKNTWHEELQVTRSGTRYVTNIIKKILPIASDVIMIFPSNMFYPWASHKEPWLEAVTTQESFVQPETWSLHCWHLTWKPKKTYLKKGI